MASLFEAYITNLGKYNEGELVGETLKFPTTTEEVQALLKRIGVDGVRYEEFFITSFDGDVLGDVYKRQFQYHEIISGFQPLFPSYVVFVYLQPKPRILPFCCINPM